ncbi:hypothetical protein [Paracoccus fontiphilus]|uniref:Uncharacterized protein n=1 Tax=Paracoccus fontiphilus TaxID=1815556 RepID=A0ABV7IF58_9RHOB|nr:hypothetical protein [Paracoccus fontiphilus]
MLVDQVQKVSKAVLSPDKQQGIDPVARSTSLLVERSQIWVKGQARHRHLEGFRPWRLVTSWSPGEPWAGLVSDPEAQFNPSPLTHLNGNSGLTLLFT